METTTENIVLVGCGLVGRGWAIVFARAGYSVTLYDDNVAALADCHNIIALRLDELVRAGLIDAAEPVLQRIRTSSDLAGVLSDAHSLAMHVEAEQSIEREVSLAHPAMRAM
jgi:3-hydroxyacyl-CoA dehydrogenase